MPRNTAARSAVCTPICLRSRALRWLGRRPGTQQRVLLSGNEAVGPRVNVNVKVNVCCENIRDLQMLVSDQIPSV